MSRAEGILYMFLLLFLLVSTTFQQTNTGFNDVFYNKLNKDMYAGFAWKGLHAFYWKGALNISDSTSFVQYVKQHDVKIALVADSKVELDTMWVYYSRLYELQQVPINYITQYSGTCKLFHVFDDFDILITLDTYFYSFVRLFNHGKRKPKGETYYFTDFTSVYLEAPFRLYQWVSNISTDVTFFKRPNCTDTEEDNFSMYEGEVHMSRNVLTQTSNGSLLTEKEVEFLKFVNSFERLKQLPSNDANLLKETVMNHFGCSNNSSLEYYHSLFLPNCTHCTNSECVSMKFSEVDYWIVPTIVVVLFYYLILFGSRSFLTPALKSRLLVPYLPFISIYLQINSSSWVEQLCNNPRMRIFGFIITWYIMTYSLTILRIYYLRNLYHLLAKNRKNIEKKLKTQRTISGPLIGIVFTFFGGFILSAIFSIPFYFTMITIPNIGNAVYGNIIIGIYVGVACLVGLFSIIIDLIFNRKKIKEKGLRYLLFFDDPYMIRIEMALISLIIICIIIISTVENSHPSRFFLFCICVCIILISGGVSTLKSISNKILNLMKRNNLDHHSTDDIDLLMKNSDFRTLLREFCTKEMSLENYNIYTQLMEMKEKEIVLDVEMMRYIEENYMDMNSLFELNISSHAKKEFSALLKRMESESHSKGGEMRESSSDSKANSSISYMDELNLILKDPILLNLGDTLSRLETTKEYTIWNQIYSIQSNTLQQ